MFSDGSNLAGTAADAGRGTKPQRLMPCDKGTWQLDCTRMFPTSTIILVQWEIVIGLNPFFVHFLFSKADKKIVWTLNLVFNEVKNVFFFYNWPHLTAGTTQCDVFAQHSFWSAFSEHSVGTPRFLQKRPAHITDISPTQGNWRCTEKTTLTAMQAFQTCNITVLFTRGATDSLNLLFWCQLVSSRALTNTAVHLLCEENLFLKWIQSECASGFYFFLSLSKMHLVSLFIQACSQWNCVSWCKTKCSNSLNFRDSRSESAVHEKGFPT